MSTADETGTLYIFTFLHIFTVLPHNSEDLLAIAAIERVNAVTATMMTIMVNWSEKGHRKKLETGVLNNQL